MIEPLKDLVLVIVADRFGPKPIGLSVVLQRGSGVGHIDDDRNDRFDAIVGSPGHPSSPTAFGSPANDELAHLAFAPHFAGRKLGDAIHGAHDTLDHRQTG